MAKYNGSSKSERKNKAFLIEKATEARQKWGTARMFGGKLYYYVGAFYPSGAKWYGKEYGKQYRVKMNAIKLKGKIVGYHVWGVKK